MLIEIEEVIQNLIDNYGHICLGDLNIKIEVNGLLLLLLLLFSDLRWESRKDQIESDLHRESGNNTMDHNNRLKKYSQPYVS